MSLINKMLQDLDARGSQAGSTLSADVRPAPPARRRLPVRQIAIAASVLVLGGGLAAFLWLKRPAPVAAPVVTVLAPVALATKPVAQLAPAPAVAVIAAPITATPVQSPEKPVPAPVEPASTAPVKVAPPERTVRKPRPAEPERVTAFVAVPVRSPAVAVPVIGGRDMNASQRAESQYRVALAALEEGRVTAALEGLEQALKTNPRHDAARQSMVALLIEAGRNDEAMQQLEQGLAIDPAQPTLAMLLARMQIERGNSGVATLLRTLPSATGNADYHAFLGGALQREARHREAVEQYGAALRQAPEHGVWLMGLGISLQAEKRDREALAAFQRARASGTLTPPLLAFVERKVQQLGQ